MEVIGLKVWGMMTVRWYQGLWNQPEQGAQSLKLLKNCAITENFRHWLKLKDLN